MSVSLVYSPGICSPIVFPISDSFTQISSAQPVAWNVQSRVTSQVAVAWNIKQQQVTVQAAIAWNTEFRVKANNVAPTPGVLQPIIRPISWHYDPAGITWNIEQRKSSTVSTSWRVLSRRSSRKAVAFNIFNHTYSLHASSWKVLQRVRKPGVTGFAFFNGITQPISHPLDSSNVIPSPTSTWNVAFRLHSQEPVRWNTFGAVKSQVRSLWNTLGIHVQKQGAVAWNTFKAVRKLSPIAWNMAERIPSKKRILWNTRFSSVSQKQIAFNVRELVRILKVTTTNFGISAPVVHPIDSYLTAPPEIQWAVNQRISSKVKIQWNYMERVSSRKASSWNTLFRVSIPNFMSVYSPGILQAVVHPFEYRTYPWGPRIEWNVGITHVISQVTTRWNVMNKVKTSIRVTWNMNQRTGVGNQILWNTMVGVVSQSRIQWNVGQNIPQFIRQTSVSRQDFAY